MARMQKNKDPERWLLHNRNGKAPSSATAAVFKAEAEGRIAGLPSSSQPQVSLVGGRKLKTVEKGTDGLFGDDDEDGGTKRRKRQNEAEGDVDEMTYDLEFTDDEEHAHEDGEDEEAKELEVRGARDAQAA
jgi:transcription initiation factor TFIIF subunit alpha